MSPRTPQEVVEGLKNLARNPLASRGVSELAADAARLLEGFLAQPEFKELAE